MEYIFYNNNNNEDWEAWHQITAISIYVKIRNSRGCRKKQYTHCVYRRKFVKRLPSPLLTIVVKRKNHSSRCTYIHIMNKRLACLIMERFIVSSMTCDFWVSIEWTSFAFFVSLAALRRWTCLRTIFFCWFFSSSFHFAAQSWVNFSPTFTSCMRDGTHIECVSVRFLIKLGHTYQPPLTEWLLE